MVEKPYRFNLALSGAESSGFDEEEPEYLF
jgi:hypothetical protein